MLITVSMKYITLLKNQGSNAVVFISLYALLMPFKNDLVCKKWKDNLSLNVNEQGDSQGIEESSS